MSKEAMKLALEALKSCDAAHITDGGRQWYDEKLVDKAVEAIEKALAEQPAQQEPVAFSQFLSDVVTAAGLLSHGKTDKSLAARISEFAFRLRTSPQPAQQEPVAWISEVRCVGPEYGKKRYGALPVQSLQPGYYAHTPLYTSPLAKCKPLTDEQKIAEALRRHGLTLVKTTSGYDVLKLGQIDAHGIKENT